MAAMMWVGAIFAVSGIVMMALAAINRGRLSDSHADLVAGRTLEPWGRGLGFLRAGWPGLLMLAIGALLLLAGGFVFPSA